MIVTKGRASEAKSLIAEAKLQDTSKTSDLMARKQQLFRISGLEGKVYGLTKDFKRAEQAYRESLKIIEEIGYEKVVWLYQYKQGLGEALFEQGRKPEALKELLEAKSLHTKARATLQSQNKNRLLNVNFSHREIDETISLIQRR